jgi:hypothetical protein
VNATIVTRLGMAVAGAMLAHLVASKALRDAAFLSVWPATRLPVMMIVTAAAVMAAVPGYAALLARWGPRRVVPAGFLLSAALHVVEWRLSTETPWVAVLIYLHVAGLGAILLSGFWSLASELFDPATAKVSFGRIAAAGTLGGLAGGLASTRLAAQSLDAALLFLAAAHVACAVMVALLGTAPSVVPSLAAAAQRPAMIWRTVRTQPHLRTLAILIALSTAGAAIVDFLFKASAQTRFAVGIPETEAGPALFQFFALFYTAVQVLTFAMQNVVGVAVRRLGLGRTITTLPASVGGAGLLAFLYPVFELFVVVRGIEAVMRGSLFRSGYELLFVPMDAAEKRRMKTFLDVTCDRAGDALGAVIVQAVLLAAPVFVLGGLPVEQMEAWWLLACVIALAAGGLWVSRRLDALYLGVVERQLVRHAEQTPVVVGSETGWTVIHIAPPTRVAAPPGSAAGVRIARDDPRVRLLSDLRSGDRDRVEQALTQLTRPDRAHVADVIQLLAWDDLVGSARRVLEAHADAHVGLLVDVLIDQETDFAIRRRIPRILGTLSSARALEGLVCGLDDPRFEVRYGCARALDRMLAHHPHLHVQTERVMEVVERELSLPLSIWQSHQIIDRVEREDEAAGSEAGERPPRNLEHVFILLSTVLPREPVQVAFGGIRSENPGLRGLAIEYLEGVLPAGIRAKLYERL